MRRELLDVARPKLAHVLPDLRVGGCLLFIYDLAAALTGYQHVLLYETSPTAVDPDVLWISQMFGLDVQQAPMITEETIAAGQYSAAILYSVKGHDRIGDVVPTIYYAYGEYDNTPHDNILIACSKYAVTTNSRGEKIEHILPDYVIPPAFNSRALRAHKDAKGGTIGILSTADNYPYELVAYFAAKLPAAALKLVISTPTARPEMLANWQAISSSTQRLFFAAVKPTAASSYMKGLDILVYGSGAEHFPAYGRLAMEAMASGLPVVCERKGAPAELLTDNEHVMMFDSPEEAYDKALFLHEHRDIAERLAANAALWASWQDISVNIGRIKGILRMLGA